jgi:acyl-CoA synthetase (AMP-forming)/AMP-acid ligase II
VDDAQVRLVDEGGKEVAEGETGELLVRGPNLFAGYWNDPAATSQSLDAGWYHTGDIMRQTGDELEFVGRKKDIIIRAATNISPVEVEQAIAASHPMVEEAGVAGIPDPVLGQRVVGFVKLAAGHDSSVIAEIREELSLKLAAYKIPERITLLDALPRTALGKVDRSALQKLAMLAEGNQPLSKGDERRSVGPAERRRRVRAK